MEYTVQLLALGGNKNEIRKVNVPQYEADAVRNVDDLLNLIYRYGQNEFQPQKNVRSVSVGDVIVIGDSRYQVVAMGFKTIAPDEEPLSEIDAYDLPSSL